MELEFLSEIISKAIEIKNNVIGTINESDPISIIGAAAWIMAGGAHHTAFSYDLSVEQMVDWADAMGIESIVIDKNTDLRAFKNELKWNAMYYR